MAGGHAEIHPRCGLTPRAALAGAMTETAPSYGCCMNWGIGCANATVLEDHAGCCSEKIPHPVHLRCPSRIESGEGRLPDRFPAPPRGGDDLPGRRHRRRLAAAGGPGTGRKPTTTSCRSCCARRARARASPTSPATTTSSCACSRACISAASSLPTARSMSPPNGKRFLVIHGDQFDTVVMNVRWLAYLGDRAYELAMLANRLVARVRRLFGLPYWSFSSWAKVTVKQAVNFIGAFQDILTEEARRSEVDGVICGHIHHAAIEAFGDVQYINTGDWVESCTAVVEHFDGRMEILHWPHMKAEPSSLPENFVPVLIEGRSARGRTESCLRLPAMTQHRQAASHRSDPDLRRAAARAAGRSPCGPARRAGLRRPGGRSARIDWSSRFRRQAVRAKGADSRRTDPSSASRTFRPSCPCRLFSLNNCVKPRYFELRISLIFAAFFYPARRPSALFPALARSQGFRCRADRHHPCRTDVPARRHHADDHRHGRPGKRPGQCADRACRPLRSSLSLGYFLPADLRARAAVSLALTVFWTPHSPLADLLALSGVRRFGSSYPRMRIWGSLTFLAASFVGRHDARRHQRRRRAGDDLVRASRGRWPPPSSRRALAGRAARCRCRQPSCRKRRRSFSTAISCSSWQASASSTPATVSSSVSSRSTGRASASATPSIGLLWAWAVVCEVGIFLVFNRVFGSDLGERGSCHCRRGGDPALDRLSADRAAGPRRSRLLRRADACMRCRPGSCSSGCRR